MFCFQCVRILSLQCCRLYILSHNLYISIFICFCRHKHFFLSFLFIFLLVGERFNVFIISYTSFPATKYMRCFRVDTVAVIYIFMNRVSFFHPFYTTKIVLHHFTSLRRNSLCIFIVNSLVFSLLLF